MRKGGDAKERRGRGWGGPPCVEGTCGSANGRDVLKGDVREGRGEGERERRRRGACLRGDKVTTH